MSEVFVLWVYLLTYLTLGGYIFYLFWRHWRAR